MSPYKKYKKKPYKNKVHSEIKLVCLACVRLSGNRMKTKQFKGKLYGNNDVVSRGLSRHLTEKNDCDKHYRLHVQGQNAHRFFTSRVDLDPKLRGKVTFTAEQFGLTGTDNYTGQYPTCEIIEPASSTHLNARLDKQVMYDDSVGPISRLLMQSDLYYLDKDHVGCDDDDDED